MNKYQEALERICNNLLCGGECVVGGKPCSLLEPIQELVDKATPKKTIKEEFEDDRYNMYKHYCPTCKYAWVCDVPNYCPECGQRLG